MLNGEIFCSSVVCWPEAAQAMTLQPEKNAQIQNRQSTIFNRQSSIQRGTGVESMISLRMASAWSDFLNVEM